ncbi:ABC transporter permease [Streptomyces sp. P01-B04]|uniref:ABC transporter permease n=2 Tax=Streptomyces TaxID=1883 RepID=UPI001C5CEC96|nr:ABC transporter permease [Streptomyces poriferorum]MBW5248099.1 ABC transporter permease [Streptomyces poriferorum]MBW5255143.1 ABC transporter permease [Streptomyces poriferorum]
MGIHALRVMTAVRQGFIVARTDFAWFYTWKTWLGGWLVRVLCQVAFYSIIGVTVGDPDYVVHVVLGAALMICVAESLMTVASTTWDLNLGTFPLLAASPVVPGGYYFGRSMMWPLSATATTSIAIFTMSLFFDLHWTAADVPLVVVLVLLTSFATYCMALVIGAVALLAPGARNVMSAVVTMAITAFCGAVVPVDFWPSGVGWAAQAVPVTHGLNAIRHLESGADLGVVARSAGLVALVGVVWLTVAMIAFRGLFNHSRRGSASLS